jgi:small subunit ribosomal protein S13e
MAETKKTTKKPATDGRDKAENIEKIVVDLAKKGIPPAKIGLILRDKHNIPKIKHLGKKITQILKENKIEYETDLDTINKKISKIETHYQKNKQDKRSKREIVRFIGLRKKLERYKAKKLVSE